MKSLISLLNSKNTPKQKRCTIFLNLFVYFFFLGVVILRVYGNPAAFSWIAQPHSSPLWRCCRCDTHIHTHTYTHTYIHEHTHIHTRIHNLTPLLCGAAAGVTHTYIHTHTHKVWHTHTYTHVHTYIHARTYTHAFTTSLLFSVAPLQVWHTHTHTYAHTYTHTYMHAHTHTHSQPHSSPLCRRCRCDTPARTQIHTMRVALDENHFTVTLFPYSKPF